MIDAARSALQVAPGLLGCTLVCRGTAVVLVEVEAYHQDDPASHSFGGTPTPRTEPMFEPGGALYVYFTYGMHYCANLVTGAAGVGEAVLFRAGVPIVGEDTMAERRGRDHDLANGPAKLVQALDIRREDNGVRLVYEAIDTLDAALAASHDGPLLIADPAAAAMAGLTLPVPAVDVAIGPRIGISKAVDLPWRFGIRGSRHLSKTFADGGG